MVTSRVIKCINLNILHYECDNTCDTGAYSDPTQTFEMELFAKVVNSIKQHS